MAHAPEFPSPAAVRPRAMRTAAAAAAVLALAGWAALVGFGGTRGGTAVVRAGGPTPPPAEVPTSSARSGSPGPAPAIDRTAASMDASREGLAAYARGDINRAVEQFRAAVEVDPGNAEALNNLGQALVRSGRARDALPHFDRAVEISRSVWAYHFNRARAYGELNEWPRAIAGYRDAVRLFPDDYVTAFNLARALQANGDANAALSEFERAATLAPAEPDFHLSHAEALDMARRPREAALAYRRYLDLDASSPKAEKVEARLAQLEAGETP